MNDSEPQGRPTPGASPPSSPPDEPPPLAPSPGDVAMARFGQALHALTPNAAIVYVVLALNVGVYAAMVAQGVHWHEPKSEDLFSWGANFGPLTLGGEWWRLLSCTFVHAGILHLALNMFSLWAVGRVVVRLFGNVSFVAIYLASGVGGSIASIVWNPWSLSVGASGALFGVFGALAGYALRLRKDVPEAFLKGVVRDVAFVLVINLVYSFTAKGIDVAAHVGGLGVGFLAALLASMPPEPAARRARAVRAVIVVALAALGTAAAVLAMPSSARTTLSTLEAVDKEEQRALDAYNGAVRKVREGALADTAFADVIDKDVLPGWRAMKQRLEGVGEGDLPERLRARTAALKRYVSMRDAAWAALAAALRNGDSEGVKAAMAKSREAETIMREAAGADGKGNKP